MKSVDECSSGKGLILPKDVVKITKMNHLIEIQHMEKTNRKSHIRKLDKFNYVDLDTGEIKAFEISENRQQNYNSLRQTFKKLRYLINNNFIGSPNELHVTLTYKKNMKDSKQLYKDFDTFLKRLRYEFKDKSTIDYINVVEPQERGAWHCHSLFRFNDLTTVFIENSKLRKIWGNGFVTIKSLKDVDNIGAYLSAYLTDVELTEGTFMNAISEEREIVSKLVDGEEKRFIKGGRLHMYPPGMNLFRKSKGCEYPERKEMLYENTKKIVGTADPHYFKSYHIENDEFQNTITFEQYNLKR